MLALIFTTAIFHFEAYNVTSLASGNPFKLALVSFSQDLC